MVFYCLFFFFLNFYYERFVELKLRWLYNFLYTSFEFVLFTFFIINYIESKKVKTALKITSAFFLIFLIIYFNAVPLKRLDAIPIGVETILLYIFMIPYLKSQFKVESSNLLFRQFHFWIVVGIMFYLAGTFFFNIVGNELNKEEKRLYWHYSYLADIIKNLFFTIAIMLYASKSLKKSEPVKRLPDLDFTL